MSEQALTKIEPMPSNPSVEGMIALAIERGATVETLERLMAIRREVRAEQAKEAYDRALADFQAECPTIQKTAKVMNKDGRSVRYQYAPLDAIIHQIKGILQKHGFSYSVNAKAEPTQVTAVCKLTHAHGHSESSEFAVPIDKDAYMNPAQQVASALTFAKRYAFCNACGIMTGDQDDDSQASHPPKEPTTQPSGAKQPAHAGQQASARQAQERPRTSAQASQATEDQRQRWLKLLKPIESAALAYAYERGILNGPEEVAGDMMPGEPLELWPLEATPTTKKMADMILRKIQAKMDPESAGTSKPPSDTEGTAKDASGSLPGHKDVPLEDGVETMTGTLETISIKEGRSSKGKWTRYGVKVDQTWFSTFDHNLGKLAQQDEGQTVTVFYKPGERGNELIGLEPADNRD